MFIPSVIEREGRNLKSFDIPTKLLENRIIYLGDEINEESCNSVVMQLLWLSANDPSKDIDLYINSPGGICSQGFMVKDVIDTLPCKVNTVGLGLCASMGAYLLSSGTGKRKGTKSLEYMIHSVQTWQGGSFPDVEINFKQSKKIQDKIIQDLTSFTKGKTSLDLINKMCQRDCYLDVEQVVKLGLIDEII